MIKTFIDTFTISVPMVTWKKYIGYNNYLILFLCKMHSDNDFLSVPHCCILPLVACMCVCGGEDNRQSPVPMSIHTYFIYLLLLNGCLSEEL